MSFDALFAPGGTDSLLLVFCRVTGLMLLAPTFSAKQVPAQVKVILTVLFTLLVWPVARAAAPGALTLTAAMVLGDVMIGMVLGLAVALILGAAEMAGEVIGMQAGLSGAASIDPVTFTQTPTMGTFIRLLTLTLLLSMDLHLVLLDGLAASLKAVPLGTPLAIGAGAKAMANSAGALFVSALQIAAPVIVSVLVLNVSLGLMTKAAPQLQVMSIAFPVQTGLGLVVLGGALPFFAAWLNGWRGTYDGTVDRLLTAFVLAGG
ncbi:MAG: flagellar biosynthetic protein FliR [Gemmatimonadaceae bacterium]|nr:flagellar biosynthetic protein FliR [Gemmatimonadaceae bacterium]